MQGLEPGVDFCSQCLHEGHLSRRLLWSWLAISTLSLYIALLLRRWYWIYPSFLYSLYLFKSGHRIRILNLLQKSSFNYNLFLHLPPPDEGIDITGAGNKLPRLGGGGRLSPRLGGGGKFPKLGGGGRTPKAGGGGKLKFIGGGGGNEGFDIIEGGGGKIWELLVLILEGAEKCFYKAGVYEENAVLAAYLFLFKYGSCILVFFLSWSDSKLKSGILPPKIKSLTIPHKPKSSSKSISSIYF